ncbi:MAG: hypothetical protein Q9P01_06250 [Anaerolineae bacterium]|nr:hypothetical protein [Anaerolineae bacterium]
MLLIIAILTVVASLLMYFGDGNALTWLGAVGYLVLLLAFTWISTSAPPPTHKQA